MKIIFHKLLNVLCAVVIFSIGTSWKINLSLLTNSYETMYLWILNALLVCVAASDEELLTFNPSIVILNECIEHQLINIGGKYKFTSAVKDVAYLAARRFRAKSMSSQTYNKRFNDFFNEVRSNRIAHSISTYELSNELRSALKQAVKACTDDNPVSSIDVKILEKKNESISIAKDENLSDCIKNHLKFSDCRDFHKTQQRTKFTTWKIFYNRDLFYDFLNKKMTHNFNNDRLSAELDLLVRQAVEDCTIDKLSLAAVPTFKIEPSEAAQLLNLILVKWPQDLRYMIQTQNGRRVLRRYASDASSALLHELYIYKNNIPIFRSAMRLFWNNRAREMYDANCAELPYIPYSYTLNYPIPHMILSDFKKFIDRKNVNFNDRNPSVHTSYLNEISNIHKPHGSNNQNNFSTLNYYGNNGMTTAEHYFENQINQFYRILFFFLELRTRGICSDENDIYDGPIPGDLIPEDIQAIIHDDNVYRDYLWNERLFYKMLIVGDTQNPWIHEENLVLLRSNMPSTSGNQPNSKSSNPGSVTTTKAINMITQSPKRKDNVWKNENGKCFPKRAKTSTYPGNNSNNKNLDMKNFSQVTNSSIQGNSDYIVININDEDFDNYSEFCASQQPEEVNANKNFGYGIFNYKNLN